MKRAQIGKRLIRSASEYNQMVDVVNKVRKGEAENLPLRVEERHSNDILPVWNKTGYALQLGNVVELVEWKDNPEDHNVYPVLQSHSAEKVRTPLFAAVPPTPEASRQIGVITSPCADNVVGRATTGGPAFCKIMFPDKLSVNYLYAVPIPGEVGYLKASPHGWIRIMWHEEINPPQTGTCESRIVNGYVYLDDDCQWSFFKLLEELKPCNSARAYLCDECGNLLEECPVEKVVHLADLDCVSTKLPPDSIVLALYFASFRKWIAINWQDGCPDMDEVKPTEDQLLKTYAPTGWVASVSGDGTENETCQIVQTFDVISYYLDGCGNICSYDSGTARVPLQLPVDTVEYVSDVTMGDLWIEFETEPVDVVTGVSVDTSKITLTGKQTVSVVTGVSGSGSVTFNTEPRNVVTSVSQSPLSATGATATIPTVTEATLDLSGLGLSGGTPQSLLSDVSVSAEAIALATTPKQIVTPTGFDASALSVSFLPTQVVTGGTASVGDISGTATYQKATGIDWSSVTFTVNIPTKTQEVVTSVTTDGCNVTGTKETVTVIDPSESATVTISGTPKFTYSSASAAVSVSKPSVSVNFTKSTLSGTISGSPLSGESVDFPVGVSGGGLAVSKTTSDILIPTGFSGGGVVSLQTKTEKVPIDVTISGGNLNAVNETLYFPVDGTCEVAMETQKQDISIPSDVTLGEGAISTTKTTINEITNGIFQGELGVQRKKQNVLVCPAQGVQNGNV